MTVGEDFARAVADKDRRALAGLLADDVDFKGLTPGRLWEATDAAGVTAIFFDTWFADEDRIVGVGPVRAGETVGDTEHVSYRFDLANDDGPQVAEQQAYYRATDGRISHLRVMCSGFRPRGT